MILRIVAQGCPSSSSYNCNNEDDGYSYSGSYTELDIKLLHMQLRSLPYPLSTDLTQVMQVDKYWEL